MKKYLLAAAAIAAIASPAAARDGSPYAGIEAGVLFAQDTDVDVFFDGDNLGDFTIDYKTGFDVDGIVGYDFGMIRAEAELGWKRTKADSIEIDGDVFDDDDFDDEDLDGNKLSVLSLMGNVLFDIGGSDRFGFYAGGGFGRARVKVVDDSDSAWAWQLIAGVRTAVSENIELGLKYRYFNTGRLHYDIDDGEDLFGARAKFRSHSILASLIFNFGGAAAAPLPPPPPPPPPPVEVAPATQTCADGSVVLVTDSCPLPPAPPPPPPPAPERG